jgi:hypothetical protein
VVELVASKRKARGKKKKTTVERQAEEEVEAAPRKPEKRAALFTFCARCGVSIPERWKNTGEAERVGARLLCSACSAPIRAGKACAGCSRKLGPNDKAVSSGGSKRICALCAVGAQRMKVCSRCQVIIPRAAVERGEVVEREGKFLCLDCAAG